MYRSTLLLLGVVSPVFAQLRVDDPPVRPQQFASGLPSLTQPREDSLRNRVRELNQPISVGLIMPRPPEEATVDMEAVLRELLPDEERLERDEVRLRSTIRKMQGIWRVERMTLDGVELDPERFAGLKYFFQDRFMALSETSEAWARPAPITEVRPVVVERPDYATGDDRRKPIARPAPVVRLGPAAIRRPVPAEIRLDPRQEESVLLHMLYEGEGRVRAFWWDRDGESIDPHLSRNAPSLRVSWPVRANMVINDRVMTVAVRGVGLWSVLPSKFHKTFNDAAKDLDRTELEPERRVSLVLVRDEIEQVPPVPTPPPTRRNIIPELRRVNLGQ